jgi:hypothetical protein
VPGRPGEKMKFFKNTFVSIAVGSVIFISMMSALASVPAQPRVQIDQYDECVQVIVIEQGEEKKKNCPADISNYKREYVRTID